MEKYDMTTIQSLDELPMSSAPLLLIMIPVIVFFFNIVNRWVAPYLPNFLKKNSNRLSGIELTIVLVGFFIDDYCTSIGMQAQESPYQMVEGNPFMGALMQWWIKNGFAKTETAAHRLTFIVFFAEILLMQYFKFYTVSSKIYMLMTAMVKAWAGYGWCLLKPNDFTFSDWISFKDGRPTPERMSIPLIRQYNAQHGLVSARRRIITAPISGAEWYMRYLPYIFPTL